MSHRLSSNKDLNALLWRLVRRGWTLERGRKHLKLRAPNGRLLVAPSTPSDWRSLRNLEHQARRCYPMPRPATGQ
jgi:hypothetical protein